MSEEAKIDTITPRAPADVPTDRIEAAEAKALQVVTQVKADPADLAMRRQLTMFGSEAEQETGQTLELLETRLGTFAKQLDGANDPMSSNLVKLRGIMDELNPHPALAERENLLSRKGIAGVLTRTFRKVPGVGDILADVLARHQSLASTIEAIMDGLERGGDMLLKDNIELEQLYERVQAQHAAVNLVAYQGELIWQKLDEAKAAATEDERRRLDAMISKIAIRVQDLRMMEQVFEQFYAGLTITTDNNLELIDSARRTRTVTKNVLTIGLALQAALHRQKQVGEAVAATRQQTSDLLAANAATIRQQSAEVAQLANSPVLAMDKLREAHVDLMAAMDEADAARKAAAERAKTNLGEIAGMRSELESRTQAFQAAKDTAVQLDAGEDAAEAEGGPA